MGVGRNIDSAACSRQGELGGGGRRDHLGASPVGREACGHGRPFALGTRPSCPRAAWLRRCMGRPACQSPVRCGAAPAPPGALAWTRGARSLRTEQLL